MRRPFGLIAILLLGSFATAAENTDEGWEFDITPYLWLPTISGDLNFEPPPGGGGGGPSIAVGPTDWLDLLNGVALISGGARKGRFSVHADFVYLGLESDKDRVSSVWDGTEIPVEASLSLTTKTDFDGMSWTLGAGYTMVETERSMLDLIGGVRYLGLDVTTNWNLTLDITGPGGGGVVLPAEGSRAQEVELWDGIIGVRGHFLIGNGRWAVPYYLDVGTGSSALTWQALAGFSYSYNWGELMLMYRHLDYNEGTGKLLEGLALSGPAFGARFRF